MSRLQEVKVKAITITSFFEGWLAGNFDGQGMSYGYLQWNFGSGTLQPLFLRLFYEFPEAAAILPDGGVYLKKAIESGTAKEWSLNIQYANGSFNETWYEALSELYTTFAWQQIMEDASQDYFNVAERMCTAFNMRTDRNYCLAFDLAVQNGGLGYYDMLETSYDDRMQSWIETAVYKTTGQINGSVDLCKEDVRNRKTAIKIGGPYGNKGWPAGISFDDLDAFVEPEVAAEPMGEAKPWVNWESAINLVAAEAGKWKKGLYAVTKLTEDPDTDTGDLEILQYLPVLIEKTFNFRESVILDYIEILKRVTDSPEKWIKGIEAVKALTEGDSDTGDLEILQYLPTLLVKIYAY